MRVVRIAVGYALACVAAAATLVLFVYTPAEFAALPSAARSSRLAEAGLFVLVVIPHVATFAALPALAGIVVGELRGIATWGYYATFGVGIAVLGFLTQHFTETPDQATILQNYALTAFLTAGLLAGVVYWLASGRFVIRRDDRHDQPSREPPSAGVRASANPPA